MKFFQSDSFPPLSLFLSLALSFPYAAAICHAAAPLHLCAAVQQRLV